MPGYLDGQALLMAARAGQGTIVVVEGDTAQHDQYFYTRWFGNLATEVSFFAQNGWEKVIVAVADLRQQMPLRKIYGIVDRDFAPSSVLIAQQATIPADGILRTTLFTLENYLLDPDGWLKVVLQLKRNQPPPGWQSVVEIKARIDDAYRVCLPLAARNFIIHEECAREPTDGLTYRVHPQALRNMAPETELASWESRRQSSPPIKLADAYKTRLSGLTSMTAADWQKTVTGKAVLRVFLDELQRQIANVPCEHLASLYVSTHATPPADLDALVRRLL